LQGAASSQGTAPAVIMEPGVILQRAGETFAQGNVAAAIALLDQYAEYFPNGTDELYWYYGQFYEANSPSRNILRSLDYYRRLVNEYPQSSRVNDARRRIAYLERFYINIQ
jgi:outer membrane protein assembly factor BamD (BamD/ComL family)